MLKQYAPLLLCLFFGILILLTLLDVIPQWSKDWRLAHPAIITAPKPITTERPIPEMLTAIPSEHLFGQKFTTLAGHLPIADLDWRVLGIVKVENAQGVFISKVYLSIAGGPGHIYQKGDRLQGNIVINKITKDAVIVEHDGRLEKLPLLHRKG